MYFDITYLQHNITQKLLLVAHDTYLQFNALKTTKNELKTQLKADPENEMIKAAINRVNGQLAIYKPEYENGTIFTDNSPLYDAIDTGKLELPASQGGTHLVKIVAL
jgi:hypothetical protein